MLIKIFATEILQGNLTIDQIPVRLLPLVKKYLEYLRNLEEDEN